VLVWMMVVAPLGQARALFKRWEAAHVPIAVKPGGYDVVVRDLAASLERADIHVTRRLAHWAYDLPGKVLAVVGGEAVGSTVTEFNERDFDFEEWEILYRLLLQVRLRVSATGTDALETADEPKPALRDRVVAAARVLAGQSNGH